MWLELGFPFLFYGVEYWRIWVCSNGFISLTSESAEANPQSIPSNSTPNAVIAPFWRDLKPNHGGSITYGKKIFNGEDGNYYFVVSWNNVLDANGNPQTFQLLIQERRGWGSDVFHNKIFFQYKSITKDLPTSIGVENQLGLQGYSISLNSGEIKNSGYFGVYPQNEGSRLIELKIKLTKNDNKAKVDPLISYISGYNVELLSTENPYGDFWATCVKGAAEVLISRAEWAGVIMSGAGMVIGGLLVLYDVTAAYASAKFSNATQRYKAAGTEDNESFVYAICKAEEPGGGQEVQGEPFDASLASTFEWSFMDSNNADHVLTITAEALYYDFDRLEGYTVSTSVTLNMYTGAHYMDIHTSFSKLGEVAGVKVWIDSNEYSTPILSLILPEGTHTIKVQSPVYINSIKYKFDQWAEGSADNPKTIQLTCDLNIEARYKAYYNLTIYAVSIPYGGGTTYPTPGTYEHVEGSNITVTAVASEGFIFTHWTLDGAVHFVNPISVLMDAPLSLTAYFTNATGDGETFPCPTLLI
ncbi:MAG: hypothetical protein QXQ94_10650 [Candidatus Bathyarchaeia archaeon]